MKAQGREISVRPSSCAAVTRLISDWAAVRPELNTWAYRIFASATELERQLNLALTPTFEELGIKGGDYEVLGYLRRAGPPYQLSPTELSQLLHLTTGAMTRRLDRLESAGYVTRLRHGSDRRAVVVQLTSVGVGIVDTAVNQIIPVISSILAPVQERTEEFEHIVGQILNNLTAIPVRPSNDADTLT